MRYSYQAEKFAQARRNLMLPHTQGEAQAIAGAFHECSLGLHGFDRTLLDQNSTLWVNQLDSLMDTNGLTDPSGQGLWAVKASRLTSDDKIQLSHVVDELAHWFDMDD